MDNYVFMKIFKKNIYSLNLNPNVKEEGHLEKC